MINLRHTRITPLTSAIVVWCGMMLTLTGAAAAQTVCVVCSEPDAVYRCQADSNFTRPGDTRLNLLCITELAHAGQHGSCSVRRQQGANACDGPLRTVAIVPPPAAIAPQSADSAPAVPSPEDKAARLAAPPDTVEELAKRTAAQSKEQLDAATGAVGDVAKKTTGVIGNAAEKSWRCLSSLFKDC